MSIPLRVLIVEDSDDDAALLARALRIGGYEPSCERVQSAAAMRAKLLEADWDIVISDFSMPQFNALDALAELHDSGRDLPFIIVSGTIGEDRAVLAMKAGAHDYVFKGNLKRLLPAVERELREAAVRQQRREAERRARHLAYHDALTDLPNRTRFLDGVREAIDRQQGGRSSLAILLMDLERFKEVNDTLGHQHGDSLLRQFAVRLRAALPAEHLVARLGGDEFGVLLRQVEQRGQVLALARDIQQLLETPIMIEGIPVAVEASLGAALVPQHADDADSLLRRAEMAMYHAKQHGTGYALFQPEFDSYSPQRLALMAELRDAIGRRQLLLHYQPIIDLQTRQQVGVEALVRWQHRSHGLLLPDRFIGFTERTGLIRQLTGWVLAEALAEACAWQRDGHRLQTSVNLSARCLHDLRLPERVAGLLQASGAAAGLLKLEITESALIAEPARAIEVLNELHAMGVALSIDDFGTGYTSLNHIKNLPVDEVKVDQRFVLNMLRDPRDAAIVQSVIELGHNLGLGVVAEGVESAELLDALGALGCDRAQGYHIGRPAAAADVFGGLAPPAAGRAPAHQGHAGESSGRA
jgi:diguanylate cyclase